MRNHPSVARSLPYLTRELCGTGGRIRQRLDDFYVEERPLYEPDGEGPHYYFEIEKRGLSTREALRRVARHMEVSEGRIGYAGMKDARAVTRQRMSLEQADVDRLRALEDPKLSLRGLDWHRNKLKQGHLEGNQFRIRVRGVGPDAVSKVQAILGVLKRRGVPNFFGPQRFGDRGDSALLGKALVSDDLDGFVAGYLGRPRREDPLDCRRARSAFESGEYERSMDYWPRRNRRERRALAAFIDRRRPGPVLSTVPQWLRRLFVSAFQSQIFNELLTRRIRLIDRLYEGDIARVTESGGMFEVEDCIIEQSRVSRFEISPTGVLPGTTAWMARGTPGRMERTRLNDHGIGLNDFERVEYLGLSGTRRPFRVPLREASVRRPERIESDTVEVSFLLPPASYATSVVREITKSVTPRERRMPRGF